MTSKELELAARVERLEALVETLRRQLEKLDAQPSPVAIPLAPVPWTPLPAYPQPYTPGPIYPQPNTGPYWIGDPITPNPNTGTITWQLTTAGASTSSPGAC